MYHSCICSVSDLRYLFSWLSSRNTQTPPDLIIGPGLGSFLKPSGMAHSMASLVHSGDQTVEDDPVLGIPHCLVFELTLD